MSYQDEAYCQDVTNLTGAEASIDQDNIVIGSVSRLKLCKFLCYMEMIGDDRIVILKDTKGGIEEVIIDIPSGQWRKKRNVWTQQLKSANELVKFIKFFRHEDLPSNSWFIIQLWDNYLLYVKIRELQEGHVLNISTEFDREMLDRLLIEKRLSLQVELDVFDIFFIE